MRHLAVLTIPILLVACESREIVSICAAEGDPDIEIRAAFHDAEGARAVLFSDPVADQSTVTRATLEEPVLPLLWREAETTMRASREVEASPCGLSTGSFVTVTFADGSSITRQTSCTGNAVARVASEVLDASDLEDTTASEPAGASVATLAEACERLP